MQVRFARLLDEANNLKFLSNCGADMLKRHLHTATAMNVMEPPSALTG
jgi:hypothetical protein